jgi:hypothetical protein
MVFREGRRKTGSSLSTTPTPEFAGPGPVQIALFEDIAMNRFDFTPYRRTTVGFDRLFDLLERQARANAGDNYPPSTSSAGARTPTGSRWPWPGSSPRNSTSPPSRTCW